MIVLIEGGFFAGGHELIKERIAALCEKKKKSILIVPEQDTVSVEGEMTELLPSCAPLYFEATNFTRLADIIFRAVGGSGKDGASAVKRALVMWRTLTELSPLMESYTGGAVTQGNVTKMLGAIKQMQALGISPEELASASDKLYEDKNAFTDKRLVSKLNDISKVMALYKTLLSEKFTDSDDILMKAESKLSDAGDFLADTEIFIDGFTSFTEPQYRLVSALSKKCRVTIALTLPKASQSAFEYSEVLSAHKKIVQNANLCGTEVKLERIDGRSAAGSTLISEITDLLWKSVGKIDTDALNETESIKIYEAETPYDECDFIAQDIKKRVMNGAKYSDFGIIARSVESYYGILDTAFEKAKIPLFISKRTDIASYEAIKLIYSAIAVVSGGFSRSDVISYAKCSLSGVERNLADEFEIYVEKWQISGKRFTDGIMWNMNPSGLSDRRRAEDEEKLLRIDQAKNAIITPLLNLYEAFEAAKTTADYSKALIDFLTELDIERRLEERSREEVLLRGCAKAQEMKRLWKTICDALDALCETLGDLEINVQTYFCLLKITFSEIDIGKIPAFSEEVNAGSADIARMNGKKHIYILGANAGMFPLSSEDNSFFTDKDKSALSALGLAIESDTDVRTAKELYYFTRSLSFARSSVSILYHAKDSSFKASSPSDAITRIKELSCEKIRPTKISSLKLSDKTYTAEYAAEHLSEYSNDKDNVIEALSEYGMAEKLTLSERPIRNASLKISTDSLSSLYGKSIQMTQSKLELYSKCPMNYFCSYNLSLKHEEKAEFDARSIGNFIHAVLENFFTELKARGKRISEITEKEKNELILKAATQYTSKCFEGIPETSARLKDTVNKLCAYSKPIIDGLCDEFSNCKYEPLFFELEIDKKNPEKPEPIIFKTNDGKEIYISGKIDRVDAFADGDDVYVRVVDYKSGKKAFSPSDIENGTNLQMFLYLKSITETDRRDFLRELGVKNDGRVIPAGVLYVKTVLDDAKISHNNKIEVQDTIKNEQKRLGMLLDDKTSISAMNPEYIPIKFKKDGEPDSRSKTMLYTADGWEKINETIERSVAEICDRMTKGDINATPLVKGKSKSSICEYCNFKAICRNAN